MKKEVKEVKEQSWAMDILKDYKKANVRLFIVWIITFISFVGLLCYTIYLSNDIATVETTTQEITDIEKVDGSIVNKGDIYGDNKANSN